MLNPARLKRWIPSEESIGSAAVAMLVATFSWRAISNPAFWGALAAGRSILAEGIPFADRLSFTAAGAAWMDAQWLYHAGMAAAWSWGGPPLVILLKTVAVTLAVFLSMNTARRIASPTGAAVSILAILPAAAGMMDVSALTFTLPLASASVAIAARPPKWKRDAAVWIPVQILWMNLHPSGLIGPCIAAASAVAAWMDFRSGRLRGVSQRDLRSRTFMPFLLLAACAITPYGIHLFPFIVRNAADFLSFEPPLPMLLTAWNPPPVRAWVSVLLAISAAGVVIPRMAPPAQALSTAVVGLVVLTRSGIAIPLLMALGAPFLAFSIDEIASWIRHRIHRASGGGLPPIPRIIPPAGIVVAAALVLGIAIDHSKRMGNVSSFGAGVTLSHLPSGLASILGARPDSPRRILCAPADGAYLSWTIPGTPVFVDLRAGGYPPEFRALIRRFAAGDRSAFDAMVNRWALDAVLLNPLGMDPGPVLRTLSQTADWKLVFFDGVSALYLRHTVALTPSTAAELRHAGIEQLTRDSADVESALARGERPRLSPRLIGAAYFFMAAGHPAEAASAFDLMRRAYPDQPRIDLHLGVSLQMAGRPVEAAAAFRSHVIRNPKDAQGWAGLADALRASGLTHEADEAARRAASLLERVKR